MSLNIFVKEDLPKDKKIITDIEGYFIAFASYNPNDEATAKILMDIDSCSPIKDDAVSILDRFGYKIHLLDLSSGCKTALSILSCTDESILFSCNECGINARDSIVRYCKHGNIIWAPDGYSIELKDTESPIDVNYYGDSINSIFELKEIL